MIWFIYAALTAFFESVKDLLSKKSLKNIDEYLVAWALSIFTVPLLLPFIFFTKIPQLNNQFWFALMFGGILNVISAILYMKALKHSDLSLTVPMITFTPVFLLFTSPLMLGEFPPLQGIVGILLIVAGVYILNIKEWHNGYLAPFKALLRQRGPQLMMCVALVWSISANFDKLGVKNSSPLFWVFALNIFEALGMVPFVIYRLHTQQKTMMLKPLKNYAPLFFIGIAMTLSLVFHMIALQSALVVYVISVKRTSALLGVVWGCLFLKEQHIPERLLGAVIMIVGVVLIAVS